MAITIEQLMSGVSDWMCCESPPSDPPSLWRMAEMIRAQAAAHRLRAIVTEIRASTRHGPGPALPLLHVTNRADGDHRPGLLVLGHRDTVHPIGMLSENPVKVDGDRLYGPGGYDMKAGVYLVLTALGTLSVPGSCRLPIDLLVVPDEETRQPRITLVDRNLRTQCTLLPGRRTGPCQRWSLRHQPQRHRHAGSDSPGAGEPCRTGARQGPQRDSRDGPPGGG